MMRKPWLRCCPEPGLGGVWGVGDRVAWVRGCDQKIGDRNKASFIVIHSLILGRDTYLLSFGS
jgi:hypothetical protein